MKLNPRLQKLSWTLGGCAILVAIATVSGQQVPAQAETERALRQWDAQWAEAAKAKEIDKIVSYYSADALVMPPNSPGITNKQQVRKAWKEMLEGPGAAITWEAKQIDIAQSGEMAYITGTYEFTMNGPDGKPVKDHGKYLEVVKKQDDGTWKCVVDMWNSDLPVPGSV